MTLVVRGYQTELKLNNAQRTACLKHAGAARYAYNWGLRRYQEERAAGRKAPNAMSLHKELNALKQTELPWMYEVSKAAPQESLRDLEKAFRHFWKRCQRKKQGTFRGKLGFPRFKSKKRGIGSFRLTGAIHIGENWIQLPRLGTLRLKERGYLPTTAVNILSATVSERAGRWYVSVQLEEEHAEPGIALGETIGIDVGIKALATLSDGRVFPNPKALGSHLKQLKRRCRQHARKQQGSKNRQKAARKLARLHAHIANLRKDTLHQVTSLIVAKTKPDQERPTCIVLEDLQVSGMVKNGKLSRAITDVGWSEFRRQLAYKAKQVGSLVYTVSRWEPSSKTCSWCGWIDEDLMLSDRLFHCAECGYVIDRDLNAAINLALKAAG
ncbi:RNA-guided endonuclease InsQ/TnpB family protein [Dictyobacter formicarum]|uniref:Transposase n=1 Tax=Dictyobacter formicarum TaxID=2778368 RepID=A0ABQ3VHU0_9CHLR|nr:RNA-guided endonuclease TnpB family protein [Dictyobacter formicarum]GHO85742.1 transposase [Dictyobacter formicarum]